MKLSLELFLFFELNHFETLSSSVTNQDETINHEKFWPWKRFRVNEGGFLLYFKMINKDTNIDVGGIVTIYS